MVAGGEGGGEFLVPGVTVTSYTARVVIFFPVSACPIGASITPVKIADPLDVQNSQSS